MGCEHNHMLHRTGLLTEAQVRGSKATERSLGSFATSDLCLCQQPSSMKYMIMDVKSQNSFTPEFHNSFNRKLQGKFNWNFDKKYKREL